MDLRQIDRSVTIPFADSVAGGSLATILVSSIVFYVNNVNIHNVLTLGLYFRNICQQILKNRSIRNQS